MGWNGVKTVVAGEPVLIEDHNTYVNENLLYLLTPNHFRVVETSGTYTTTSASLVDVHANYSKAITTYGGQVLVGVYCEIASTAGGGVYLYLDVDGTDYPICVSAGAGLIGGWIDIIAGLSAGSHTLKLQFANDGSHTTTITKTNHPFIFWAVEI